MKNIRIKLYKQLLTFDFMKRSGFVVIFIFIGILSCNNDNRQVTADLINFPPSADSQSDSEVPVISFDSTTAHFGKLVIGEKFSHTYKFTNAGKSPLIISQVTPSCGCTTPKDWSKDPILPGEAGQISVEFNSTGFPGKIDKSVSVLTNCLPRTINLSISGEVIGVESFDKSNQTFDMDRTK